jgi:hypothetical protein
MIGGVVGIGPVTAASASKDNDVVVVVALLINEFKKCPFVLSKNQTVIGFCHWSPG